MESKEVGAVYGESPKAGCSPIAYSLFCPSTSSVPLSFIAIVVMFDPKSCTRAFIKAQSVSVVMFTLAPVPRLYDSLCPTPYARPACSTMVLCEVVYTAVVSVPVRAGRPFRASQEVTAETVASEDATRV